MPRIGVRALVDATLEHLEFLGRGPGETYNDRCRSGYISRFQQNAADRYHPYVMPQEYGHIADLYQLQLSDDNGNGLLITSAQRCEGNVNIHSDSALWNATHTYELERDDYLHLHLDAKHRGLGSNSCGPDTLTPYRVQPGQYGLNYLISLL